MLSYVLPVEEKVGLREEEEERSPGSETRPLLEAGSEGASLAALQHALSHASHSGDKPPVGPRQEVTAHTLPPNDASTTTTATSSAATSPGPLPPHPAAPPPPTTTTTTTVPTTISTTATAVKPSLKRVSFGSSKGSMVETLIYDSPVGEEERIPEEEDLSLPPVPFKDSVTQRFGTETGTQQKPASRVRVTFYESTKPLIVTSPEPSELDQYSPQDLLMASPTTEAQMPAFDRQLSTESGRDNPFRPDGDISKEADQIVEAIKSGRPLLGPAAPPDAQDGPTPALTPTPTPATEPLIAPTEAPSPQKTSPVKDDGRTGLGSPGKAGANGSTPGDNLTSTPGPVEVTHVTVTPADPANVERVVIKKKNKCSCCVIQ